MDALSHLRIIVLWTKFVDMDRGTFIEIQTITPGETPTSSIGGKEIKPEEEGAKIKEEEATKT